MKFATLQDRCLGWFDQQRHRAFRPRMHHDFFIVTAAYNAVDFIERNLASVAAQAYPRQRVTQLIYDDASSDGTAKLVQGWLASPGQHHLTRLISNCENRGGCANLTSGFRQAPRSAIVLQLDGDDWLPDPQVLSYLNRAYHDADVWMTYNSWAFPDGRPALNSRPVPRKVINAGAVRSAPWTASHLHSFRARLFEKVRQESLIDPATSDYFRASVDLAHYLPMLELAGHHARHLRRTMYTYNLHPDSLYNAKRDQQLACEQRIRALSPYQPLEKLD